MAKYVINGVRLYDHILLKLGKDLDVHNNIIIMYMCMIMLTYYHRIHGCNCITSLHVQTYFTGYNYYNNCYYL